MLALSAPVLIIFLVGLRSIVRSSRPNWEWAAALIFGTGLVVTAVWFLGNSITAPANIDATGKPEPAAERALFESGVTLFGSLSYFLSALLMGSAAYATQRTRVLPRWTAWGRLRCGGLNLIGAGSLFGGNNPTGFYSANGFAGVLGLFPFLIWVACVSGAMIAMRAPRPVAPAVPGS